MIYLSSVLKRRSIFFISLLFLLHIFFIDIDLCPLLLDSVSFDFIHIIQYLLFRKFLFPLLIDLFKLSTVNFAQECCNDILLNFSSINQINKISIVHLLFRSSCLDSAGYLFRYFLTNMTCVHVIRNNYNLLMHFI
jgi:hypothetical protein